MSDPKPFASLSPSLLARKGGARPAMRPQIQPLHQFHEATARQIEDDLGWNDMGHEAAAPEPEMSATAEVVSLNPSAPFSAEIPAVVRQQQAIAGKVTQPVPARARRSALSDGRRAAFTLRLDAERHLKLRLACTLSNRSAQQIVIEALDALIDGLPDVSEFAAQVRKRS